MCHVSSSTRELESRAVMMISPSFPPRTPCGTVRVTNYCARSQGSFFLWFIVFAAWGCIGFGDESTSRASAAEDLFDSIIYIDHLRAEKVWSRSRVRICLRALHLPALFYWAV